jgi:hypothetical protein
MKFKFIILLLIILSACRQKNSEKTSEQIELILLGFFENIDTTEESKLRVDLSKFGSQKYFKYDGSDSLLVKSCTYLDEITGEPNLPVECKYYKKAITPEVKSKFDFFIKFVRPLTNGELIRPRPKEYYCDLFGGWIVIYTGKDNIKRHFVFDCYGLPDSIHHLCNNLNFYGTDTAKSIRPIETSINTDSIVQSSYKILESDFINRRPKNPTTIKFTPPKERYKQ